MTRKQTWRLVLTLALAAATGRAQAVPNRQQTPCRYDFTPVTSLIRNAVNTAPLQGASLLLIKDGRVVYEQTFGSYTRDTVVPIASATKWLSASVIMSLVDDGLLSLDDPAGRFLPNFTGLKGTMTIRQMFSHTSGLPSGLTYPPLNNPFLTLEQCVGQISQISLIAPPGTQFVYGSLSMQVAGRVAEVAGGKPWVTLFQERVAGPLQMTSTNYYSTSNPRIDGGARTKLHDYGAFLQMILNNGVQGNRRVLSLAAVREMERDQTFGVPLVFSPQSDGRRYGIGVWRDRVDTQGNATQLSSQGAFGFAPWIDRNRQLVAVFLVQTDPSRIAGLVDQMQQQIRDILDNTRCDTPLTSVR